MLTPLYASQAVSITDLKRNISSVLKELADEPVVVLNHNKPEAYILSAARYEKLLDLIEDLKDAEIVRQRRSDPAVKVDRDALRDGRDI
jgi:antitoxin StbD